MSMTTMYYRPQTTEPEGRGELPSHDALQRILPDFRHVVLDPNRKHAVSDGNPPAWYKAAQRPGDTELTTIGVLDHQLNELEKYRSAVRALGTDLIDLRQVVQQREVENSSLRRALFRYDNTTKLLLDGEQLDTITKPELAERYVAIKQKLTKQTLELKEYKDRVCHLQNELIKRDDEKNKYKELCIAHQSQQALVQKLQNKVHKTKRLEETCRNQEDIIEKMEQLLAKMSQKDSGGSKAVRDAMSEENARLRRVLEDAKEQLRAQEDLANRPHQEHMKTLESLERQNSRVRSLEKQIADNARQWARERADLQVRLQENALGLPTAPASSLAGYSKHAPVDIAPLRPYGKGSNPPSTRHKSNRHSHCY